MQQSGSASATASGGDVQTQIQNAIKNDPTLASDSINVNVTDKDVELTGNVNSKNEKKAAKKIAEQYAGKLKVKDHLKVNGGNDNDKGMGSNSGSSTGTSSPSGNQNPPSDNSTSPRKPPMSNNFLGQSSSSTQSSPSSNSQTGSTSGNSQGNTPDNNSSSQQTTGSSSSQTQGTSTAPSSTTGGVSGSATDQTQGSTSGSTSGSTGAVGSNQSGTGATTTTTTTTETQTGTAGADLQSQIQNALKNEPTLSNDNVNVTVSEDSIDLSGSVATGKEKQTAKRIAQSYAGNRKVKDHLTVSGRGQDNGMNPSSTTNPSTNPDQNKGSQQPPK
jgi:osmotically-inducible protein OsmY